MFILAAAAADVGAAVAVDVADAAGVAVAADVVDVSGALCRC